MKTTKDRKVKLEKGEVRVGNFFIKPEKAHVKVQDISTLMSFRISCGTAAGMWLREMVGRKDEETLHIYATTLFSTLLTVPDDEFVGQLVKSASEAVERHPEWYSVKREELSDEEQAKVVEEEKEKEEFVEQVRSLAQEDEH